MRKKRKKKSNIEKIKIEGAGQTDSLHSYQYNEYDKLYIIKYLTFYQSEKVRGPPLGQETKLKEQQIQDKIFMRKKERKR